MQWQAQRSTNELSLYPWVPPLKTKLTNHSAQYETYVNLQPTTANLS